MGETEARRGGGSCETEHPLQMCKGIALQPCIPLQICNSYGGCGMEETVHHFAATHPLAALQAPRGVRGWLAWRKPCITLQPCVPLLFATPMGRTGKTARRRPCMALQILQGG